MAKYPQWRVEGLAANGIGGKMRSTYAITLVASLALCPFAMADLLWDNYAVPNGWDGVTGLSSERATLISDSWVVDDAVFDQPVFVEEIQWIGFRGDKPLVAADYIIMDSEFQVIAEVHDAPFSSNDLGVQFFGFEMYEGSVTVSAPVELAPGQYFIGTRLVGEFLGRNFAATSATGAQVIFGESEAYFKSVSLGFDDWTAVNEVLASGEPSDFAYRIIGTVIPEPASLILLAIGVAAMLRRRR